MADVEDLYIFSEFIFNNKTINVKRFVVTCILIHTGKPKIRENRAFNRQKNNKNHSYLILCNRVI